MAVGTHMAKVVVPAQGVRMWDVVWVRVQVEGEHPTVVVVPCHGSVINFSCVVMVHAGCTQLANVVVPCWTSDVLVSRTQPRLVG